MQIKDIISSGLLELYITGLSSREEAIQVEEWISQYPEIKSEIEDLQHVMEEYALSQAIMPEQSLKEKIFSQIHPAGSVKDKIFSRIDGSSSDESISLRSVTPDENANVFKMPYFYKFAAAACITLLIGASIFSYIYFNKYNAVSSELSAAKNDLQQQQQLADAMNKDINVMTDKFAQPVVMNGTPHSPDALAKIFWMKNSGEVYVDVTNLPQTPQGKQYQLWAIVDGKPVDAGMISTEKGIYHIQKMKSFGKAEAFAITLEKTGGSPTPTMDQMIVQAKI